MAVPIMTRDITLLVLCLLCAVESARILVYFPVPSISHQQPVRRLSQELARRGHDVVVITTDPAFEKGKAPPNLTEVDLHDMSYKIADEFRPSIDLGNKDDARSLFKKSTPLLLETMVRQLKTPVVNDILYNGKFDLIILEAMIRPALIFSHFHKVPIIQMSSFPGWVGNYEMMGAMTHPTLYPLVTQSRLNNVTMWDKIKQIYTFYGINRDNDEFEKFENEVLRQNFDPNMPDLYELYNNVALLLLNAYPVWDFNRPVGPNVVYVGGIHEIKQKELPKDLQTYLDYSKNGVVYLSFGSNVVPSSLSPSKIQMMVNVFSQLPYDVLWKWDKDELPGRTKNIRIAKWLPQADILRHPNVKAFITQGGLQSTDEALTAGVPLIGIPMLGDQWYNCEKYVSLGIGKNLHWETLTEEELKTAIEEVISDPSYRKRVKEVHNLMHDQPQTALERAVWWTEHVLRHGGGKHLRPPTAGISWREFLELDLVLTVLSVVLVSIVAFFAIVYYLINKLFPKTTVKKVKKK